MHLPIYICIKSIFAIKSDSHVFVYVHRLHGWRHTTPTAEDIIIKANMNVHISVFLHNFGFVRSANEFSYRMAKKIYDACMPVTYWVCFCFTYQEGRHLSMYIHRAKIYECFRRQNISNMQM